MICSTSSFVQSPGTRLTTQEWIGLLSRSDGVDVVLTVLMSPLKNLLGV